MRKLMADLKTRFETEAQRNDLVAGFGVVTQALVKLSSANDELQVIE